MGGAIIAFLVVALVLYVASFIALVVCYPFDKKRVVVHTLSTWITDAVFGLSGIKRKVIGMEHIDPKASYVMVLNHNSMADIITIYNLPLVFRFPIIIYFITT